LIFKEEDEEAEEEEEEEEDDEDIKSSVMTDRSVGVRLFVDMIVEQQ